MEVYLDVFNNFWLILHVLLTNVTFSSSCVPFCNTPSNWINQARNVCYGAKGDDFGEFHIKRNCELVAIRLSHVSGVLWCIPGGKSRWGCRLRKKVFGTYVKGPTATSNHWEPKERDVDGLYNLPGYDGDDDVIVFKMKRNVTINDNFMIGYGQDIMNESEANNGGNHCVDVDISYLV